MNLWGKRTGLFFLSALFVFSSCKDELNKIGTQADQDKFQVHYKEFNLPSTTVLLDSVRTDNTPTFLVGGYDDALFGRINSTPYISFFPNTSQTLLSLNSVQEIVNNETIEHEIILDDLVFRTRLDQYHYGYAGEANDNVALSLHKLSTSIKSDDYNFNYSTFDHELTPLVTLDLNYNTATLDTLTADSTANKLFVFEAQLPASYVQDMDQAIQNITLKDLDGFDSTLVQNLPEQLFGFVLKSEVGTRDILGLSPFNTAMWLRYHHVNSQGVTISDSLSFSFIVSNNFNNISSDRASSPLAEIVEFDRGYDLGGTRYTQAGTGIGAVLNFDDVLTFLSTEENVIVNSAELIFGNVIADPVKATPSSFNFLSVSNDYNRTSFTINGAELNTMYTDQGDTYSLSYDTENNVYKGIPRRYFQDLYDNDIDESSLVINPINSGYSLNRFAINENNIKLKLYYSLPNN